MSTHTPGPWRKGINDDSVVSETQSEEQRGCLNFKYYGGNLIAESIENHNIPLIAAAPDLLQVLKDIEAMLNGGLDASIVMDENSPARDAMRDAIAKAEGGAV